MSDDRRLWFSPNASHRVRVEGDLNVGVVGGGLAGVAAALVLAERGARVTLYERESVLGGRVAAWSESVAGDTLEIERGFHAFFRQYYNVREFLRRIDPSLSCLTPCEDYPLLGPHGQAESFAKLPRRAPYNLLALVWRTKSMSVWQALRVERSRALEMLAFDMERTYARWDGHTAKEYLDSLGFPPRARQMLFDIFAHSFFNPEESFSAAELLMMFHYYFLGNPEGLVFDVLNEPFGKAVWQPMAQKLAELGVDVRVASVVRSVAKVGGGIDLHTDEGAATFDAVVGALSVPALKRLVANSPEIATPSWRSDIEQLDVTLPFAVWRLWLDRPCAASRSPFAGTTGVGMLDNISLYHLFEGESRRWAERTGGAVVELHAYAVPEDLDEPTIKHDLREAMFEFYPETHDAKVLDERFLLRRDCPAFAPGSSARRPTVETPEPALFLAGDLVRLPIPSALMERAVTSGMMAANRILEARGVQGQALWSIPVRGVLA